MEVLYNPNGTKRYSNHAGVFIRPYAFGGLDGVTDLDPLLPLVSSHMGKLSGRFEAAGYERGKHLFGAPYDFRLAPDGLEEAGWYGDLRRLVELGSRLNAGRRCVLVCHGSGCLVVWYFLRVVADPQWRDKYIARMISLNTPWEGSAVAVKGLVSGDNYGLPFPAAAFRRVQATSPSTSWLLPSAAVWGMNKTVIRTRSANYTSSDMLRLMQDLGLGRQAEMLPGVSSLGRGLLPLDTRVYCLYGVGLPTPLSFKYDVRHFEGGVLQQQQQQEGGIGAGAGAGAPLPPDPTPLEMGDGDGVAPFESLAACGRYSRRAIPLPLPLASHQGVLHSSRYVDMVVTLAGFADTVRPPRDVDAPAAAPPPGTVAAAPPASAAATEAHTTMGVEASGAVDGQHRQHQQQVRHGDDTGGPTGQGGGNTGLHALAGGGVAEPHDEEQMVRSYVLHAVRDVAASLAAAQSSAQGMGGGSSSSGSSSGSSSSSVADS